MVEINDDSGGGGNGKQGIRLFSVVDIPLGSPESNLKSFCVVFKTTSHRSPSYEYDTLWEYSVRLSGSGTQVHDGVPQVHSLFLPRRPFPVGEFSSKTSSVISSPVSMRVSPLVSSPAIAVTRTPRSPAAAAAASCRAIPIGPRTLRLTPHDFRRRRTACPRQDDNKFAQFVVSVLFAYRRSLLEAPWQIPNPLAPWQSLLRLLGTDLRQISAGTLADFCRRLLLADFCRHLPRSHATEHPRGAAPGPPLLLLRSKGQSSLCPCGSGGEGKTRGSS